MIPGAKSVVLNSNLSRNISPRNGKPSPRLKSNVSDLESLESEGRDSNLSPRSNFTVDKNRSKFLTIGYDK